MTSFPDGHLFLSTSCAPTDDVVEAADVLAGITTCIELSGGKSYDPRLTSKLGRLQEARGITFLAHGYFPPPPEPFILNFADTGAKTRSFITQAVAFVSAFRIPYYSLHAGFRRDFLLRGESLTDPGGPRHDEAGIIENLDWFSDTFPGIPLLVENLYPNNGNSDACLFVTPGEIRSVLDARPRTGLLLDLGHLAVSARSMGFDFASSAAALLEQYGPRIREIHLSGNDGSDDEHRLPTLESVQVELIADHRSLLARLGVNLVVEARGYSLAEVAACWCELHGLLEVR